MPDGSWRSIHLPLAPEYIGYGDIGLSDHFLHRHPTQYRAAGDHLFKYHVDFSHLAAAGEIGALCVSRPTNPTGNVLTDAEMTHLDDIARGQDIPLIVDGAYGLPFPQHRVYRCHAPPERQHHTPPPLPVQTGPARRAHRHVIARDDIIRAFQRQYHRQPGLRQIGLRPWPGTVRQRRDSSPEPGLHRPALPRAFTADRAVVSRAAGRLVPHPQTRGAIFLWLWFEDLPITSQELYQRLKRRGAGGARAQLLRRHRPGLAHRHQCLRVSQRPGSEAVRRRVAIIAEEVARGPNRQFREPP